MNVKRLNHHPHVVIVGAGFGGLRAARAFKGKPVQVTLIDRNNYHLFQPLLYQVATSFISPNEVAYPVRRALRGQKNASFRMAEAQSVDFTNKILKTSGGDLSYDYLILAAGGRSNTFGIHSVEENSFKLKSVPDATAVRTQILRQFELAMQESDPAARRERLTFVLVGGGPTGVETAGAIAELVRLVLVKDYPGLDFSQVRVMLLEMLDNILPGLPASLQQAAMKSLRGKGIEIRLGARVTGYDGRRVDLQEDDPIDCRTLIWTAGIKPVALYDRLGLEQVKTGQVRVRPTLQSLPHPEVYIIGDAAYFESAEGSPLPMVAQVAMQGADTAVSNILHSLKDETPEKFEYTDLGLMTTIGRNQAVASIWNLKLTGFLAWVAWLGVHLIQLIGFRNRLVVLVSWIWDYFFYERTVRIIEECK